MKKTTKLLTVTLAMVMAACTLTACGGGALISLWFLGRTFLESTKLVTSMV